MINVATPKTIAIIAGETSGDQLGGAVNLEEPEVVAAADVEEQPAGALKAALQQRVPVVFECHHHLDKRFEPEIR
jgi:lipid A disaccharide synthetase